MRPQPYRTLPGRWLRLARVIAMSLGVGAAAMVVVMLVMTIVGVGTRGSSSLSSESLMSALRDSAPAGALLSLAIFIGLCARDRRRH